VASKGGFEFFPGRRCLQSSTSSGASGPVPPNWHAAAESDWARRTRAERDRARATDVASDDPPTSEIGALTYDQATADVGPDAPSVKPTFVSTPVVAEGDPSASSPDSERRSTDPGRPALAPDTPDPARAAEPIAPIAPPAMEAAVAASAEPSVFASESAIATPREISTGSLLSHRYLLGRLLGAGGGSLIFQAEDRRRIGAEDFGSKIAIKVLRPEMRHNPHALTRLKREFRQMQRLSHPGIARVFELDSDEDIWFMTMELIDGQTINQWLKSSTTRSAGLQIIAGCSEALSHAHEVGIVHGDLKPSNVLVLADGKVKLVDFGSAAERDATTGEIDKDRSFAATPPYASPQVLAGEIADPRDDVFSLACLAYAVLTHGEHPFDRRSSAEAQQAQMKPAYSRQLLPRQFDVLVRALSWDRGHRPATVREFWHALLASDLRRDNVRDAAPTLADVVSHPMPSSPTRDAPTVAATKAEDPRVSRSTPAAAHEQHTASPTSEPVKREPTIKHEDILRLKAVIAAAEAHAEQIDDPKPSKKSEPAADPMASFRGYVAGPNALKGDESSDIVPRSDEELARHADETPKATKRSWPWQRSAWVVATLIAATLVFALTQIKRVPDPVAPVQARPAPVREAVPQPASTHVALVRSATTTAPPAQPALEKKSPPVAVKPTAPSGAPGEISFATRTLHVGVGQTMAALSVKRINSTRGRARVAWTIEGGTAQPGVDYRLGDLQVIEFLEGQSVRSLFIPLAPDKDTSAARTSKTFTVKLQPTNGGPKLGEIKQVYVTIVGDVAMQRIAQRGPE